MPKQWATPFVDILTSHSKEWKDAKGRGERKSVIESAAKAINDKVARSGGGTVEQLEDVRALYYFRKISHSKVLQKISNWFGNNAARFSQPEMNALKTGGKKTRAFTVRDVVKFSHKEQIREIISEKTEDGPGSSDWLSHYPGALTAVVDGLTEDELAKAEDEARRWNEERPPKEVQQMYLSFARL
jgi:hypothetical protein